VTRSNGQFAGRPFFRLRSGWPNCCRLTEARSGSRIFVAMAVATIGAAAQADRVAAQLCPPAMAHRTFSTEQLPPVLPVVLRPANRAHPESLPVGRRCRAAMQSKAELQGGDGNRQVCLPLGACRDTPSHPQFRLDQLD